MILSKENLLWVAGALLGANILLGIGIVNLSDNSLTDATLECRTIAP